jgi:plastocyanin
MTYIHTVTISGMAFMPENLTIEAGCSVAWHNDTQFTHTATSDAMVPDLFTTGDVMPGTTSKAIKFPKAGTFPYHCSYHPDMQGTITVTG